MNAGIVEIIAGSVCAQVVYFLIIAPWLYERERKWYERESKKYKHLEK